MQVKEKLLEGKPVKMKEEKYKRQIALKNQKKIDLEKRKKNVFQLHRHELLRDFKEVKLQRCKENS